MRRGEGRLAASGAMLRAYDQATGKEAGAVYRPAAAERLAHYPACYAAESTSWPPSAATATPANCSASACPDSAGLRKCVSTRHLAALSPWLSRLGGPGGGTVSGSFGKSCGGGAGSQVTASHVRDGAVS